MYNIDNSYFYEIEKQTILFPKEDKHCLETGCECTFMV